MNVKISVLVTCVEVIMYLLLYNLHDCTFKGATKSDFMHCSCVVIVLFNTALCRSAIFYRIFFLCVTMLCNFAMNFVMQFCPHFI